MSSHQEEPIAQDEANKEKMEGEEEQDRSLEKLEKEEPEAGPGQGRLEQTRQSS